MSFSGISAFFCRLSRYHTIPTFNDPQERGLLKTLLKKEKMLVTSIFSFSHNVFYPIKDRNLHLSYNYFVICKCVQFDLVQNFVVWVRVNHFPNKPWFLQFIPSLPNPISPKFFPFCILLSHFPTLPFSLSTQYLSCPFAVSPNFIFAHFSFRPEAISPNFPISPMTISPSSLKAPSHFTQMPYF